MDNNGDFVGQIQSPAGFVFGIQGWVWGEQRPTTITFFLGCGLADCCTKVDVGQRCQHRGRVKVCDQYGRPMLGTVAEDGKRTMFDQCSHAEAIAALAAERFDWTKMSPAGWPQLPYEELKKLRTLPPTSAEELSKILDPQARQDALRARREADEARVKEIEAALTVEAG